MSHLSTTPAPSTTLDRPPGRRWFGLALVCLAQFMLILDVTVVNVALPAIDSELQLGAALGWTVAAYSLPFGALLIVGGLLADRIGLRTAFLGGLAVFTVASLAASLAVGGAMLIAARVAQGMGAALLSPAALGLVLAMFPDAARTRALAIWAGIGGSGAAIGALLGGVLTQAGGWRWVFSVNVPVGILVAVLVVIVVRGPLWASAPDAAGRTARAGSLRRVLRSPAVAAGAATMLLASVLLVGSFFTLTIALQDGRGFGPLGAGVAFLPAAVGVAVGAQLGAHLLARLPARAVAASGFIVTTIGFALAWLAPHSTAALIVGIGLAATGIGPALVTATATATSAISGHDAGTASGMINTVHELGGGIGLLLMSLPVLLSATATGSTIALGAAALIAALAAVVAAGVLPRHPLSSPSGAHH